jgi:hypothetical protein
MENRLVGLDKNLHEARASLETCRIEVVRATEQLGQPFAQAAQLEAARRKVAEIDEQLSQLAVPVAEGEVDAAIRGTSEGADLETPRSEGGDIPQARHPALTAAAAVNPPGEIGTGNGQPAPDGRPAADRGLRVDEQMVGVKQVPFQRVVAPPSGAPRSGR